MFPDVLTCFCITFNDNCWKSRICGLGRWKSKATPSLLSLGIRKYKLLPREKRVVKEGCRRWKKLGRPSEDIIIDVAKSEQRCPFGIRRVPCTVPNSKLYRPRTREILVPKGVMAIQGIFCHWGLHGYSDCRVAFSPLSAIPH